MNSNEIFLRPIEEADLETIREWMNRPDIGRIMGYLPVLSKHEQILWYKGIKEVRTTYVFAICLKSSGEHIGNIGLGCIDYKSRNAMLNIFIAEKKHRRRGCGSQAIKGLLEFAFDRLNLHKVYLQTSPHFEAAINAYEKIGFTKDGVLRAHYFCDGVYEDKIIYSILESEYRK